MSLIYLDANATYGLIPEVVESLKELFASDSKSAFSGLLAWNPSAVHQCGQKARSLVEEARASVAELVGATRHDRVVFTSGATEANLMALRCGLAAVQAGGRGGKQSSPELVVTEIEHPSLIDSARQLADFGLCTLRTVQHPRSSMRSWESGISTAVSNMTKLVSCMMANNESGEVLPISEISKCIESKNSDCLFHVDAVQAAGKIPIDWSDLNVDMMSLSAHKLGGLPGVGALVITQKVPHVPLFVGGAQETRWRAGTENVPGIVSFGVAARVAREKIKDRVKSMKLASDTFVSTVAENCKLMELVAQDKDRLPNTALLRFPGVRADDLIVALDLKGIAASAGAACASGKQLPSHVLLAMGYSESEARECVRFSMRADCSLEHVQFAANTVSQLVTAISVR